MYIYIYVCIYICVCVCVYNTNPLKLIAKPPHVSIFPAVTSQMKVITTAIATVVMLGRELSRLQWYALLALTCGLVVIQMQVRCMYI